MNDNIYLAVVNDENKTINVITYEESEKFQTKLLGLWEQQQKVLGYTNATISLNLRNINEVLNLADKFIWEIDIQDFDRFYIGLVGRGLAYSTRRKYQSNIITFLDYIRSRHSSEIWNFYRVQVPTVLDKFNRHHHRNDDNEGKIIPPEPEVLDRFWEGLKSMMQSARKYSTVARDYTLFKMLALSGLRIFEAIMLDVKDCRFDLGENGKIYIRYGKGSKGTGYKRRWVPMLDGLEKLFLWYLQNVRPLFTEEESGALFLSQNGKRLCRDTGRQILKRRQIELGFKNDEIFSPHQLRHAFATSQTERGVDLLTLKTLLGHASISTTFIYSTPGSDFMEKKIRMSQEKWKQELLAEEAGKKEGK